MSRLIQLCVAVLAAVVGLAAGCVDLSEDLEGEPCTVEDDCWHTQECARTIEEAALSLPGVCEPEGTGCVVGRQLGCTCNPADPATNCSASVLPYTLQMTYPRMECHPTILRCAIAPDQGGNQP